MLFCCTGEDTRGDTVMDVEPSGAVPIKANDKDDDEVIVQMKQEAQQKEEADKKRKADEAEKQRADDEAATQAAETAKQKQREDEAAEVAKKKQREDEAAKKKQREDEAAAREAATEETLKVVSPVIDAGLPLTFRDASGAKTYTVSFKSKPLGMDFNHNVVPVKVTKAFGAAKLLGVSEGSDLINIAGTDVEQLGFEQMLVVLKEKIAPLNPDGLVITFRDESGNQRPIVFPTKPLGMEFNDGKKPITIKKVLPEAVSLGVEVNWELMSIAGTDAGEMDFGKMLELLRSQIDKLPTRE